MSQAVKCDILLYSDDTCLVCQHKDINKIQSHLNEEFCNICDWFVDNKLSIHFGEDKTNDPIKESLTTIFKRNYDNYNHKKTLVIELLIQRPTKTLRKVY